MKMTFREIVEGVKDLGPIDYVPQMKIECKCIYCEGPASWWEDELLCDSCWRVIHED